MSASAKRKAGKTQPLPFLLGIIQRVSEHTCVSLLINTCNCRLARACGVFLDSQQD